MRNEKGVRLNLTIHKGFGETPYIRGGLRLVDDLRLRVVAVLCDIHLKSFSFIVSSFYVVQGK